MLLKGGPNVVFQSDRLAPVGNGNPAVTLVQLRYLVAIVEAGLNISLAAQRSHATQPGLSKQLAQIEDELGFQIFARRGKRLEALTELGRDVVERARLILAETASIQALAADRRRDARGELRIATTATQARFVLPSALNGLRAEFPDVALHLHASTAAESMARIDHEAADVALISSPARPRTSHLAIPLYRWNFIALCRKSHPLARLDRPLQLVDLTGAHIMTYDSARDAEGSYAQAFIRAGASPPVPAVSCRDSDTLKNLVRDGDGLGLLAEMALTPRDSDLALLVASHLFESKVTWAVLPRERIPRRHVVEFVGHLAPHLSRDAVRDAAGGGDAAAWPDPPLWRDRLGPSSPRPVQPPLRLVARV